MKNTKQSEQAGRNVYIGKKNHKSGYSMGQFSCQLVHSSTNHHIIHLSLNNIIGFNVHIRQLMTTKDSAL